MAAFSIPQTPAKSGAGASGAGLQVQWKSCFAFHCCLLSAGGLRAVKFELKISPSVCKLRRSAAPLPDLILEGPSEKQDTQHRSPAELF